MKKVMGFRMLMGDWIENSSPEDILEMKLDAITAGFQQGTTIVEKDVELPDNIMFTYDVETRIMGFRFETPIPEEELPYEFISNAQGIEGGYSMFELIYEES